MERFDVIVVGAGSAGAVLAEGLSRQRDRRVLLLEAGPNHPAHETPASIASLNCFRSWTEPGRLWTRLPARRVAGQPELPYLRGRGVGGSSAVNAMVAMRGTKDDYDRWENEFGCVGWGWSALHAAFLQIEDDIDYGGDGEHGRGGPMPIVRRPLVPTSPLDQAARAAILDLGHPLCDDYHAPNATGLSRFAFNMRADKRVSTNDAYLEPARDRPNLIIRGDVHVDRVLLDARRAVGVTAANGEEIEAGQVILSTGAIHSPAILLRSGIGVDDGLPVGRNLKEHPVARLQLDLGPGGRRSAVEESVVRSVLRYSSELADAGPNDMQIGAFDTRGPTEEDLVGGQLFCAVMRVFSEGELRLRSPDPRHNPIVEFNLLSDERDLTRLRDGVRRIVEVVSHPAMALIVERIDAPVDRFDDDDELDAWLQATTTDYVHAVGTCRMGQPGDPRAVVDLRCAVIGYDGLRVIDASVMPDLPKCNTNLTTIAIAQRLLTLL